MGKVKKEIGKLIGNNVLVYWKQIEGGALELPEDIKAEKEMQENGVVQIAAIGPDCKVAKEGNWAILNAGGRILKYNDSVYGIIKEHQLDVVFENKPVIQSVINTVSNNGIKLDKTINKLGDLKDKYGI